MARKIALVGVLVVPGLAILVVFGYFALQDWGELRTAYVNFRSVASGHSDLRAVVLADAMQNMHRLNLMANGVWALMGAILAGIGIHGLCSLPPQDGDWKDYGR